MAQKKLALFVEGQTELIFVRKLIDEIAGSKGISFDVLRQKYGNFAVLEAADDNGTEYFVSLFDCAHDERVLSEILYQNERLADKGYDRVLGLKDLAPKARTDYASHKAEIAGLLGGLHLPSTVIIAVMEIEAWFIEEWNHFSVIDARLTCEKILASSGFDPSDRRAAELDDPVSFLHDAYQLVGCRYTKKPWQVSATTDALSYEELYFNVSNNVPELGYLIAEVDDFLA